MTIIWAKRYKWKRNVFCDDWITMWKQTVSASRYFRRKMQFLPRTQSPILVCAAWWCEESDYILNRIDKELCSRNLNWAYDIQDIIDKAMPDIIKDIKEIRGWDTPIDFCFILLDVEWQQLLRITDLWCLDINANVELVEGSWLTNFYELNEDRDFVDRFFTAAESDEYCRLPIYWFDWEEISVVKTLEDFYSYVGKEDGTEHIEDTWEFDS